MEPMAGIEPISALFGVDSARIPRLINPNLPLPNQLVHHSFADSFADSALSFAWQARSGFIGKVRRCVARLHLGDNSSRLILSLIPFRLARKGAKRSGQRSGQSKGLVFWRGSAPA
jgi:hypothetical protein